MTQRYGRCYGLSPRAVFAALVLIMFTRGAQADLPAAVGGEPMPSLAPMLERVTPAVVNIATRGTVPAPSNPLLQDPFFRRFFNIPDQPRQRKTQSLGSGVIIDAQRGLVVTNNHVIANADEITVTLRDGRRFEAEVVGRDPETDVAVVRIPAENLSALPFADSAQLRVGDFVVAIGNPFGLGQTVTSGIISALARTGLGILGYEDYIQTDASINPGNSGGALVNLRGELVGINSAIFSRSGGNIGIGFAIPINMASLVADQLLEFGEVHRGFLGAQLQDLDPDLADAFGLKERRGAVLVNIVPDSPADKAGLKAGDVVTTLDGLAVASAADLRNRVALTPVGQRVKLGVLRDGRRRTINVAVGERDEAQAGAAPGAPRNERLAGVTFGDIAEESPLYGRLQGTMIYQVEQGSPAWRAGLREGDVITSVNRRQVRDTGDFISKVNGLRGQLLLRVQRGNSAAFVVIK